MRGTIKIDKEKISYRRRTRRLLKMYRFRGHWVNTYLKNIFCAGMTTGQRSESINFFFDGFVNVNTKLVEFVHQYDKAVAACHRSDS